VQFRGPASAVAAKLISAVSNGYQRGTYILSDGAARMEQYYLPQIPATTWVGTFDPSAAQRARIRAQICAGRVSLVILRMNRGSYDHAYDYQIRKLIGRIKRYKLAVTAGQGHYTTLVWRLVTPSGKGSCK
jgi:hypothetical protein